MIKKITIWTCIAGACLASIQAESLDEALNKQKEIARRRVFSQPAALSDQNLVVPKSPTEEDLELDRKIEALERELDEQAIANPVRPTQPNRPLANVPQTEEENKNWLTPAMLDQDAALNKPEEDSWLTQELERQEQRKLEEEEQRLLKQRMSERVGPVQNDPRNQYDFPERKLPPINTYERPSYLSEREPIAISEPRQEQSPIVPKNSSMFAPTDYTGSSIVEEPFSTSIQPTIRPEQNRPRKSSTIEWETPSSRQSPLNRVKKSSPIHKRDPFSDDFMPDIKTSIWD